MESQQDSNVAAQTPVATTDATPPITETPSTAPASPTTPNVSSPTPSTSPASETAATTPTTTPVTPVTNDVNTKLSSATPPQAKRSKTPLIMIIVVLVILAATGILLVMQKKAPVSQPVATKKVVQNTPTPLTEATPVITPVTSANVDQTLNNTNTSMQQAVSQADTDLNSINNINTSQDNTNGL